MAAKRMGGEMVEGEAERLAAFEEVLAEVRAEYDRTVAEMARLREAGKVRTVTYRQLTAAKLRLAEALDLYREHGLID
ncbi:MAG: hypothetical protein UHI81_01160 [Olegusella sp.]|nr:hypothetical protein [Olegusella sp.]